MIWSDELPSVLWAYRTTARTPTGETPFCLAYGSEAVISTEIGLTSYRVGHHDEGRNKEEMCLKLDLLDEVTLQKKSLLARTICPRKNSNIVAKGY